MRSQTRSTSACSLNSVAVSIMICSLLVAIVVLWNKVNSMNAVIAELANEHYKHTTTHTSVSIPSPHSFSQVQPTAIGLQKKRRTMKEIGLETETDKISTHGYDRFYPYFLESLRDEPGMKMLEIGYNLGSSYQMWLEYFSQGKVYFMEKDYGSKFPEARFTGDQGSVKDLQTMLMTKGLDGNLDFIIDDGSHHPQHQMTSFTYLFEHGLKPGGIYIIEDIETSYWRSGNTYGLSTAYGKDSPNSMITRLKALVDVVNRRYQPDDEPFMSAFGKAVDDNVQSIFFGPNAVVIIKLHKGERAKYDSSTYLWKDKLVKETSK